MSPGLSLSGSVDDEKSRHPVVSADTFRQMALSLEGVEEFPHFEKPSFRVRKKIFATLDLKNQRACLKLSESDQDVFTVSGKGAVYPVPNTWGMQGWTFFELKNTPKSLFSDALKTAHARVGLQRKRK